MAQDRNAPQKGAIKVGAETARSAKALADIAKM